MIEHKISNTGPMSEIKDNYRNYASQLITIADEVVNSEQLNLPPGTYTATQIHTALKKRNQYYFDRNIWMSKDLQSDPKKDVDIWYTFYEVSDDNGRIIFPGGNVFKLTSGYEKAAGWTGRKAHRFNIRESRSAVMETKITFLNQDTMKKLSKIVRMQNVQGHKNCVLSLGDGCLRGRSTICKYNDSGKKKVVSIDDPFHMAPTEYGGMRIFKNLSFLIEAEQLKHLYGECSIAIYKDKKPVRGSSNPYNYRVVITNADGWVISSDVLVDFSADTFDRQFGFEPIPDVPETEGSTEGHRTASKICQEEKSPHRVVKRDIRVRESIKKALSRHKPKPKCQHRKKYSRKRRSREKYIEHSVKKLHFSR